MKLPKPGQSRDLLAWAALLAALGVTASGEYELARACGFGSVVAAGVPAALDVYAVRAMRAGRDVLAVVTVMITVNALAHLSAAGLLPVSVPLVVAVSALAPLVLWRVHRLGHKSAGPEAVTGQPADATPQENTGPVHLAVLGEQQVTAVDDRVSAEPEADDAEETEERPRLDSDAARAAIEDAYRSGLSVRKAARLATRSPSRVQAVYAELQAAAAEPIPGQTIGFDDGPEAAAA